jgi:hypothetical protein
MDNGCIDRATVAGLPTPEERARMAREFKELLEGAEWFRASPELRRRFHDPEGWFTKYVDNLAERLCRKEWFLSQSPIRRRETFEDLPRQQVERLRKEEEEARRRREEWAGKTLDEKIAALVKMAEEDARDNPDMAAFELSAASWLETHPDASSKTGWPEV